MQLLLKPVPNAERVNNDEPAIADVGLSEEITRLDSEIRTDDAKIQAFRSSKGLTNGATGPITSERLSSVSIHRPA